MQGNSVHSSKYIFVPGETVIKKEMKSIEKDFKKLGSKTDIGI